MKIGLLGDTHGNSQVVLDALDSFKEQEVVDILHVGDFGIWPGNPGMQFLAQVNTHLSKNKQTLYVTPGNHEDYTFIKAIEKHASNYEDGWARARDNILVAPRGLRWEWNGVSFVSLGGAPSVDRAWRLEFQRKKGYPVWWKDEDITREDMDRTIAGGYADIMIAHDAPYGVSGVEKGIAGNPFNFTEEDLHYAFEGRVKIREVVEAVKPKLYFGGHYHWKVDETLSVVGTEETDHEIRVRILAADGAPNSWGILDLDTFDFRWGGTN